ncbi:MAG: TraB/GumN family protein [Pseudomonadota bacterium]
MKHLLSCLLTGLFLCGTSASWAASDAPFLWEIQGAKAKHYLMGSVHLLPASTQPLPAALENAYSKASGVAFESDLATLGEPQSQMAMFNAAAAPNGLRSLISKEVYERLQKGARDLNMPLADTCEPYKPWFCAITMEIFAFQRAGFKAEYGLDQFFFTRALKDGKPIRWLEEPQTQIDLFAKMPDKLGEQFLQSTLEEQGDPDQNPEGLLRTWRNGDLTELEKLAREMKTHQPQAYARLLADRNRAWMPKLEKILASDKVQLIVVGAAHNAGPDGLLALLKAKGYEVRAVATEASKIDATRATRTTGAPWLIPTLSARDADAAYAFYQKAFGFEAGAQTRDDKGKLLRGELKYHDAVILLTPESSKRPSPITSKSATPPPVVLYVDNLDAAIARAKKAGAEIVDAAADQTWGERTALLRDSDGYLWLLAMPLPPKTVSLRLNSPAQNYFGPHS